ncbi:YdeI/OmpD-associated family protein [Actinosynnema sp. CS-041913]|uniref:YdeI/OmpD-associated family protein n=1 Tax=Actinosynnema sp. CS-041913 TaxID=3239917 RepID=UPI003D93A19B
METLDGAEIIDFADAARWEAWLAANHERTGGVWVKIAKKGSGRTSVTLREALDVALCYGWIDSQRKAHDEHHYLQRYSPRRPTSSWSQVNVDKVDALVAAGRMREPGYAAIRAARADGRWAAAYQSQRTATVPPDLAAALARDTGARARFERLDRTRRYALLLRLMKAKTPATRAVALRRVVESLARPDPVGADGS